MKTPLSYYGGKQQLASKIVSLIPTHKIYVEPFIGGAALMFCRRQNSSPIRISVGRFSLQKKNQNQKSLTI